MFDENGISELYRKDHLLIRAIVSQFNSWDDLKERYVTERAESNKYLKNILASREGVRNMFSELLNEIDKSAVERRLCEYIEEDKEFISWNGGYDEYCDMAVKDLEKTSNFMIGLLQRKDKTNLFSVFTGMKVILCSLFQESSTQKLLLIQKEQRQHIKLPKATGWTITTTTSYKCIKVTEIVLVMKSGSKRIDRTVLCGLVSVSIMN